MSDRKIIIFVKQSEYKAKEKLELEIKKLENYAKRDFPNDTITVNIETETDFTKTGTYQEILEEKCKALYIYSIEKISNVKSSVYPLYKEYIERKYEALYSFSMDRLLRDFKALEELLKFFENKGTKLYVYPNTIISLEQIKEELEMLEIMKVNENQ